MSAEQPRIEIPASASPEEAAALVAAVEQFLRDTTVALAPPRRQSGWLRAARLEAVGGGDGGIGPGGAWSVGAPWTR